jgi:acetyl-CoA C-acetyltransferase
MIGKRVVIVAGKRTPIGTLMGGLSNMTAPQLGSIAISGALKSINIEPRDVDEVFMGNVISAGLGQAPSRQAALGAGLDYSTPTTDVNKVCASGMKSVMLAAQSIALGDRKTIVAGGMECMSKVPHYAYLRAPTTYAHAKLIDGLMFDGLTDAYDNIAMGNCAEKTCRDFELTREEQDEYAIRSYERAREAQANGTFAWEITSVEEQTRRGAKIHDKDEECQKYMPDKFASLRPAFEKLGSVTAANSSKINDGASALVLMEEEEAIARGLKPLARILGFDDAGVAPIDFAIAPTDACKKIMKSLGMKTSDIDLHEINEAFSAVVLANMKLLDLDPAKVNVHGGAVALGHPIGVSGNRIILSLINSLIKHDKHIGMASICNGGGGASAIAIERLI